MIQFKFFASVVALCMCLSISSTAIADSPAQQLLETDRAFNAMAQKQGVQAAFAHYAAPDAVLLNEGLQPVRGHAAVVAGFDNIPEGYSLVWQPVAGDVAASGDLGYTWGRFVATTRGADGEARISHGKYTSIWKRQADGAWKFVLDTGNGNPAPEE